MTRFSGLGKVRRGGQSSDVMPAVAFAGRYGASADVLNGIAYDPSGSNDREGYRLFVTGKLWPDLHEIRWVPSSPLRPRP